MFFYMIEIAQYLQDNTKYPVSIISRGNNNNSLLPYIIKSRYNISNISVKNFNNINKSEPYILIVNNSYYNTIVNSLKLYQQFSYIFNKNCKGIFLIQSRNSDVLMNSCIEKLNYNLKFILNKTYLLYTKSFRNKNLEKNIFNNRYIEIDRGFYFKYYKEKNLEYINKYLLYFASTDGNDRVNRKTIDKVYKDYDLNNIEILQAGTIEEESNMTIEEKLNRNYNLANSYKGLIYIRYEDYMPRMPFEFWYYDKPVIFYDISDGLKIRIKNEIKLYTPLIIKDYPNMDLTNLIKFLELIK